MKTYFKDNILLKIYTGLFLLPLILLKAAEREVDEGPSFPKNPK